MEDNCCGKQTKSIPVESIINKIDMALDKDNYVEAERILKYWLVESTDMGDYRGELALLSECMGLYRKIGKKEQAMNVVERALEIIDTHKIENSPAIATIYVNVATVLKTFEQAEKAIEFYLLAKEVYEKNNQNGFNLGALYNNMGLAYADLKDKQKAKECFDKALEIMEQLQNADLEIAITFLNIADLLDINDIENEKEISKLIEMAYNCFNVDNIERNGYYAFVCSKCASVFGYYGYFAIENELKSRAKEIYERN